jgi:hypothetical protein
MFRPNWPASGVQVVMAKNNIACCNTMFFSPTVVVSGYFGYVGYHQFHLGVLRLHVVAFGFVWFVGCGCVEYPCWGGSSVVCWLASTREDGQLGRNILRPIKQYEERIVNGVAHTQYKCSKSQIYVYRKYNIIKFGATCDNGGTQLCVSRSDARRYEIPASTALAVNTRRQLTTNPRCEDYGSRDSCKVKKTT